MSISAASVPVIDGGKEVVRVPCIYYLVWFKERQKQVKVLLDSDSEVNAMSLAFVKKLDFKTRKINIRAQEIYGSAFETFEMVITDFLVEDKGSKPRFFQEIFLVADTKFKVVLGMLFSKISNADVSFGEETFTWKFYTINEVLPITKQVQLIDPKEFVIAALDVENKIFVVHVAIRVQKEMPVHFKRQV